MEDNNIKDIESQSNPEVNLGAHDPKIDLARNKNLFYKSLWVAGGFVVILIIICCFQYCGSHSSNAEVSKADYAMLTANDSTSQAQAMELYNAIAKESNTTEAQRAKIFSAGNEYSKGNYQEALDYIKDVKTKSPIVETYKNCFEGDCYVNLDKVDEAIGCFKNAVSEANDNPELAPYALTKLANAYRYKGDYAGELQALRELQNKFPSYNPMIDSEVARAEAMAK